MAVWTLPRMIADRMVLYGLERTVTCRTFLATYPPADGSSRKIQGFFKALARLVN